MVDSLYSLSSSQRQNLSTIDRLNRTREEASYRLSTGRRINSPSDNPVDYFAAKALLSRLADFGDERANIQLTEQSVSVASVGLDAIETLSKQLISITESAKVAESSSELESLANQFNELREQITQLANDTTFRGQNLINDQVNAASLGIGSATSGYNNFATLSDINAAIDDIRAARNTVRASQDSYGREVALLNVRDDYLESLSSIYQAGSDQLISTDLNEEAAIALSAQVRSEVAYEGQKILVEGESLLLNLFNG